jgi:integrase/recombinase XerD
MTFEHYLTGYLEYLAAKGYAQGTLRWRKTYLRQLFTYLDQQRITTFQNVTGDHIDNYRVYLKTEHRTVRGTLLAGSSFSSHLQAITDFFLWLEKTRQILITPVIKPLWSKTPKPLKLPHVLTEEEAVKIIEASPLNTPYGLRDRAILEVLYSTGIRRMELINLNMEDFFLKRQELFIKQGKGKKDRLVPVGEYAVKFTEAYLKLVRPWLVEALDEKALFLTMNGQRLAPQTLRVIISKAVKKSGVTKRVTPHTFRHSMATHMLRNGADIRHIQAILGHASVQSTEIYTHLTIKDLKKATKKAHPYANRRNLR